MRKKFIITVALTLILGGGIFVSLNESNSQENIQSAGTENITRTEKSKKQKSWKTLEVLYTEPR